MAGKYEHIPGCGCSMCQRIEEIRQESSGWAHRSGCTCENCRGVRELGDAREAGKQDARVAKSYVEGVQRGLR